MPTDVYYDYDPGRGLNLECTRFAGHLVRW